MFVTFFQKVFWWIHLLAKARSYVVGPQLLETGMTLRPALLLLVVMMRLHCFIFEAALDASWWPRAWPLLCDGWWHFWWLAALPMLVVLLMYQSLRLNGESRNAHLSGVVLLQFGVIWSLHCFMLGAVLDTAWWPGARPLQTVEGLSSFLDCYPIPDMSLHWHVCALVVQTDQKDIDVLDSYNG